jgi:hypothetical protein
MRKSLEVLLVFDITWKKCNIGLAMLDSYEYISKCSNGLVKFLSAPTSISNTGDLGIFIPQHSAVIHLQYALLDPLLCGMI